jgi:bacterioferritin
MILITIIKINRHETGIFWPRDTESQTNYADLQRSLIVQGDPEIIDALNDILTAELTAINQYFVHYKMLENWGYLRIAKKKREESIEEMKHADDVIERILYLDGIPNMQRLFPVRVGETPVEMHELDLAVEKEAVVRLNKAINLGLAKSDAGTREMLEHMLTSEEDSIEWLEAQLKIVSDIGKERYLAEQLKE